MGMDDLSDVLRVLRVVAAREPRRRGGRLDGRAGGLAPEPLDRDADRHEISAQRLLHGRR